MPVLGPEFQTFERQNNARERSIQAKENAAVELAHSTLEAVTEPSRVHSIATRIGEIITGRRVYPEHRESVLAFYEPDDDASEAGREPSMAAYFSDVMGGVLFTRPVLPGEGPIEKRLGELQTRAVLSRSGYYGHPVVAVGGDGHEVFPDSMSLDAREEFIDQVSETLTIISAQSYIHQRELQAIVAY
jgi:hypothetical protein